jgi:hypothetical protein
VTSRIAARQSPDLAFLPQAFREPRRPLATILLAGMLSIGGSLLIATLIGTLVANAKSPDFGWLAGKGFLAVFILALATPLLETLILAATTGILLRFMKPLHAVLLSSLGWALAHSYQAPVWGLVIFWPFIIFTTLFVVWKQRSLAWGLLMPWAAHALQNLFPAIAIGYPRLLPAFA